MPRRLRSRPLSMIARRAATGALCVVMGLAGSAGAAAAQQAAAAGGGAWRFTPEISEYGQYEDNALMSRTDSLALYGSLTTATLAVQGKTPRTTIDLSAGATQSLFNEADYNSTDFSARAEARRRAARWEAALRLTGDYDTTRTSELTTNGVVDQKAVRHMAASAAPEISYRVAARDKITAQIGYDVSRYDEDSYTDYDVMKAQAGWTHRLTPATDGSLSLRGRRYQALDGAKERTDSIGPTMGLSVQFSKRLAARLTAGIEASQQEQDGAVTRDWAWSTVFSGGLTFKGAQDMLDIAASREQQPYGTGGSSLLTSVSFSETHAVNERIALSAGGRYARSQSDEANSTAMEQQIGANAGLRYRLTPRTDVSASYRFRHETYRDGGADAQKNSVMLGLTFRPFAGSTP